MAAAATEPESEPEAAEAREAAVSAEAAEAEAAAPEGAAPEGAAPRAQDAASRHMAAAMWARGHVQVLVWMRV